jgi:hypothetical protein
MVLLDPQKLIAGTGSGDMAELTMCAWTGSVPHSPGYPLWTHLAEWAIALQPNTEPIHAVARMGVLMACSAAIVTRSLLRNLGVGGWAATGAAGLLFVVPLCMRAYSIPEVLALDLLLVATGIWAIQRGEQSGRDGWTALGVVAVVLSVGHRPINLILFLVVAIGWRGFRLRSRGLLIGLLVGALLQALLYLVLWNQIHNPNTLWVDEQALPTFKGFVRFVTGLAHENFFVWATGGEAMPRRPLELGLQVYGLLLAAVLSPLLVRPRRLGWAFFVLAVWHLIFISVYSITDREFLFLPILWVGVLTVALATQRLPERLRGRSGKALLAGVLLLSVFNDRGVVRSDQGQWKTQLRSVLSSVPENAVILSDDWQRRTGLVAIREMEGIGPAVDVVRVGINGGDIQRLEEWLRGESALLLLEERKEIFELRPVRVQDSRLVPVLVNRGLVVLPAEAGTWSVSLAP